MRLDFNVLWVDDQPRRVEAQIRAIAREMEDEGFNFNPTSCLSLEQVRGKIAEDVFNDEVDLILVDWDLGGGVEGQQVIAEIRDRIQYKDVVFYSAQTPPEKLRELAHDAGLEGVYCAERDSLRDEVVGVFESLVKKVLDLDHTRGIVMGSTSDIDQMVLECVTVVHGKLADPEKAVLVKDAMEIIEKRMKEHAASFADLQGSANFASLLKAKMLFTANDRLRVLSRVLDGPPYKGDGKREHVISYIEKVVPKRNSLGHKVLLPGGKEAVIALDGEETMTLQEMRDLRKLILSLRGEFRSLRDVLDS